MAIVQPSALVSAISGSIGGVTFKTTRSGLVAAHKGLHCNQQSPHQVAARRCRLFALALYRNLSPSNRSAWEDAARAYNRRNRLGLSAIASPWSLFLEANFYFLFAGSMANVWHPSSTRYPGPEYIQAWFPTTEPWLVNCFPDIDPDNKPLIAVHAGRTFSRVPSRTSHLKVYLPNAYWDPGIPFNPFIRFQADLEARQGVALLPEQIEVWVQYYAVGFLPSVAAYTRWPVGPADQPKPY